MVFEVDALEVAGAAEEAAVLREAELHHRAGGRERQVDPRVAHDRGAEAGAHAVIAAERVGERRVGAGAGIALLVEGVVQEQARVVGAEQRKAELHVGAPPPQPPNVGNHIPDTLVVHPNRSRDPGLADRGIRVRDAEVVDVLPELPLQLAALALAEQVGFVESDEPADACALPHRRAEVDVSGPLFGDVEDDVDVALLVGRFGLGERQRLVEEPEVRDALVRRDQRVLPEHVARDHHDRLADHALVGDVVAADLYVTHDGGLAFGDDPAQIHDGLAVRIEAANHVGPDLDVDVAVVVVQRLQLARRILPLLVVEVRVRGPATEPEQAGAVVRVERIVRLQLVGREAPVADDLERADLVRLAFTHGDDERRLPRFLVDDQRVLQDLEVDIATLAVVLRQGLTQILGDLVVVVLPRMHPEKAFRLGMHLLDDQLVGEMRIALNVHLRDRDAAAFLEVEDHAHRRRIALVHVDRLGLGEVIALRVVHRIDAGECARDRRGIERPAFRQLDLVAHAPLGEPLHAADRPLHQLRALAHLYHEDVPAVGLRLEKLDVVELAARKQGLDGALHVPVVQRPPGNETAHLDDAGGGIALLTGDGDGVGSRRRINARDPPLGLGQARGEDGEADDDWKGEPANHAFEPESALNARRSLSGATSTSISSPLAKSPTRIFSDRGSSTYF